MLARVAAGHYGVQRSRLVGLGVSDTQMRRWCEAGRLEALGRGAYLVDAPLTSQNTFERERELHLRQADAVVEGLPGAYVVGRTAAWAWGAPLLHRPTAVEVARTPRLRSERRTIASRMAWGRGAAAGHPTRQDPAEAAVEVAARDGVAAGIVVADALAHRGLATDEFTDAAQRYGTRPGAGAERVAARNVEPSTESPGERVTRWICAQDGLALVPQVEIRDEFGSLVGRVDLLAPATMTVVEFDGLGKYTTPQALRAEKRRQVALERLGYVVVRLVHADLADPSRVVRLVREAIARSRPRAG